MRVPEVLGSAGGSRLSRHRSAALTTRRLRLLPRRRGLCLIESARTSDSARTVRIREPLEKIPVLVSDGREVAILTT